MFFSSPPYSKDYLQKFIAADKDLVVEHGNDFGLRLWDNRQTKSLVVNYSEKLNPKKLSELIHISSDIPSFYKVDKNTLAEYLWNTCDRNTFTTLEEIVVIWSDEDNPDFLDSQTSRLYEKYYDEYAFEIGQDFLGQLWFERNTIVVNLGEVVRASQEIEQENSDTFDPYFCAENQILVGFLTTLIHELRHLQMDTNIFLKEEEYPTEWASEEKVEKYCLEVFEMSIVPPTLFPNLFDPEKNNARSEKSIGSLAKIALSSTDGIQAATQPICKPERS